MFLAIGVVVVVVVVVLALALAGVLPFFNSNSGGGSGTPTSFSTSRAQAQSAADHYQGGGWSIFGAFGVASKTTASYPLANFTDSLTQSTCTYTAAPGAPSELTATAMGNVSTGASDPWVFLFMNTSGTSILLVADTGGAATVLGTLGGSFCFAGGLSLFATLPSNVIDSSQAAAKANAAGGTAFLAAHPSAFASFDLLPGYSFFGVTLPPQWTVTYSACAFSPTATGSAAQFTATVNATDGSLAALSNTTTTCGLSSSGGGGSGGGGGGGGSTVVGALTLGTPTVINDSGILWFYNVTVTSVSGGLTLGDLSFAATDGSGLGVAASTLDISVYSSGSAIPVDSYAAGIWVGGGTAPVTTGMTFSMLTTQFLGGGTLSFDGTGSFSGSVPVTLPIG